MNIWKLFDRVEYYYSDISKEIYKVIKPFRKEMNIYKYDILKDCWEDIVSPYRFRLNDVPVNKFFEDFFYDTIKTNNHEINKKELTLKINKIRMMRSLTE